MTTSADPKLNEVVTMLAGVLGQLPAGSPARKPIEAVHRFAVEELIARNNGLDTSPPRSTPIFGLMVEVAAEVDAKVVERKALEALGRGLFVVFGVYADKWEMLSMDYGADDGPKVKRPSPFDGLVAAGKDRTP